MSKKNKIILGIAGVAVLAGGGAVFASRGKEQPTSPDQLPFRLGKVQARVPHVVDAYQKRLDDRIQQLLSQRGLEAAKMDIVREVAIHADRCDTSEEIQRLKAHIGEFRKIVGQKGQVGRRLDFMTQEMGRETNTIVSKAGDVAISRHVFEVKATLEKLRELVQNVE